MAEEIPIFDFTKPVKDIELKEGRKVGIPITTPETPYLGKYVCVVAVDPLGVEENSNQQVEVDFTGAPGTASGLYYSLVFSLLKGQWNVTKVDEWIEVSPTHREYYERTVATKGAIETTIKQGMGSAAQAVADFELVQHDLRKYKEIADYFDAIQKAKQEKDKKKRTEKIAATEHVLKSMFIDQVDVHNGQFSMLQMLGTRWPNLIADFMQLTEDDDTIKKISDRIGISHAEAVVLKTKHDLFREWLKLFSDAVRERYTRLSELVAARETSVKEYRDWIKPHIARYRTLKLGAERRAESLGGLKSFFDISGQSTFTNHIHLYAWKAFRAVEHRKAPALVEEDKGDFIIDPWDDYVRETLVLDKEFGLAKLYPWLRNKSEKRIKDLKLKSEDVKTEEDIIENRVTKADEIAEDIKKNKWSVGMRLTKGDLYYKAFDIKIDRVGLRLPVGEVEDITFNIRTLCISQNIMLVKLIEMECREMEIDKYIDVILGIKKETGETVADIVKKDYPALFGEKPKEEKTSWQIFKGEFKSFKEYFGEPLKSMPKIKPSLGKYAPYLLRAGPYETVFNDRITKLYTIPIGRDLGKIAAFLMSKMGVE